MARLDAIRYEPLVYRDTETDANVDQRVLPVERSLSTAIAAARVYIHDHAAEGWHTATIDRGILERNPLTSLDDFVGDEVVRWHVGPDWVDRWDLR